jgi:hypothetical protein
MRRLDRYFSRQPIVGLSPHHIVIDRTRTSSLQYASVHLYSVPKLAYSSAPKMNPLDWIVKFFELCAWPILRFFGSPQMQVQDGWLGWSDKDKQHLALLLWVTFTNTREKPFLLRSLEIHHRGVKYKAIAKQGHVRILGPTGWRVRTLRLEDCVVSSPQISDINIAGRHGFFPLAKELSIETGPILFEVKATFHSGRSRTDQFGVDGISTHVPIAGKATRNVRFRFRAD